jgi:hypothetical protein
MDNKEFNELVDKDSPDYKFNEENREKTRELCKFYDIRGEIRMSLGLSYTDKEYEEYRNYVLKRSLP